MGLRLKKRLSQCAIRMTESYRISVFQASQMAEDRDFALLLHNRDLLQQMQSDSEFMTTLQAGNPPKR